MRTSWIAPLVVAALGAGLGGCGDDGPSGPADRRAEDLEAAAATITSGEMAQHVGALAHDSMRGRWSPSPELDEASNYIARAFDDAGLRPGNGASWFQTFQVGDLKSVAPPVGVALDASLVPGYPGGSGPVRNVIGWIQGSDPGRRHEYVVFSAHYDHVGWTEEPVDGDAVYNGADDNASGTAALLELAEAFGTLNPPPRRSVVFLATAAEERGLLGAIHYVNNPTFALEETVANLNLDMIGRNDPNSVEVIHAAGSALADTVIAAAARHPDIGIEAVPVQDDALLQRTDSYAFVLWGIDALFFHSGLHADYHRVTDEPARLDAGKAAAVARLAWWTGVALVD